MKNKIVKFLNIINVLLIFCYLFFGTLYSGTNFSNVLDLTLYFFSISTIISLVCYKLDPYKLNKKIILFFLLGLTFFLPLFSDNVVNYSEQIKYTILFFMSIIFSINVSNFININGDRFDKIIIYSTLITALVSLLYIGVSIDI